MENKSNTVLNDENEDCILFTEEEVNELLSVRQLSCESTELQHLLKEWGLEKISKDLEASGVNFQNLKYLEQAEIERILPGRENIGLQAEFRHKLFLWKLKTFPNDPEIQQTINCSCNLKVGDWLRRASTYDPLFNNSQSNTPSSVDSVHSQFSTHVRDILKLSKVGNGLLEYYKEQGQLDKEQRKIVVNCIVEYFFDSRKGVYIIPKPFQLECIAGEILEVFPTENKDIYFISRKEGKRHNPSGLLFNRFNNINRNKRKSGCLQSKFDCIPKTNVNYQPSHDNISIKNKMKYMQNNEGEWLSYWNSTYEYRREDISKLCLKTTLDEWPFFKQAGGEKFIDLDFARLYPEKQFNFINTFPALKEKLGQYYAKYIKDKHYKQLYEKIADSSINNSSSDAVYIILLNTVLKPTLRRSTKAEGKSKATIQDAIQSCVTHIALINDVQKIREEKLLKQIEIKGTIQPYILVVGKQLLELTDYYVVLGETLFKFSTFVAAFETCFKAFQVFNLKYPKESELFWLFIQKYSYDIETEYDLKSSVLTEFIESLKVF